MNNEFLSTGASQGWQCPICKRVLAPFITECPCKGFGSQWTLTSTKGSVDLSDKPDSKDSYIRTNIYFENFKAED